jgi:hypothetical protein
MIWQLLQVRHLHDTPLIFAGRMWRGLLNGQKQTCCVLDSNWRGRRTWKYLAAWTPVRKPWPLSATITHAGWLRQTRAREVCVRQVREDGGFVAGDLPLLTPERSPLQ